MRAAAAAAATAAAAAAATGASCHLDEQHVWVAGRDLMQLGEERAAGVAVGCKELRHKKAAGWRAQDHRLEVLWRAGSHHVGRALRTPPRAIGLERALGLALQLQLATANRGARTAVVGPSKTRGEGRQCPRTAVMPRRSRSSAHEGLQLARLLVCMDSARSERAPACARWPSARWPSARWPSAATFSGSLPTGALQQAVRDGARAVAHAGARALMLAEGLKLEGA